MTRPLPEHCSHLSHHQPRPTTQVQLMSRFQDSIMRESEKAGFSKEDIYHWWLVVIQCQAARYPLLLIQCLPVLCLNHEESKSKHHKYLSAAIL